jgi:hypothetical protein
MSSAHSPTITANDQPLRIREIFLHRQPSYGLGEAARLLGMSRTALRREAEADDRATYCVNGFWRFAWRHIASFALRQWTLAEIHNALGPDAKTVLPPLLTLRALTVRLPEYLVRAIEVSAASEDTTIDDWLQRELMDFAGTVADRMDRVIPGYRRAYLWPGGDHGAAPVGFGTAQDRSRNG